MTTEQKEELDELKEELEALKARKEVLDNNEDTEDYDEALDCEGTVKAGGYDFYPSRILQELDPIAYDLGLADFYDAELSELETAIREKEAEIEDLQNK